MKVKVTKQFRWSPDGTRTVTEEPGNVVEGRAALVALAAKRGVVIAEEQGSKAVQGSPENKAITEAPRNKAR